MKTNKTNDFMVMESNELATLTGGKRQNTDVTRAGIVNSTNGKGDYYEDANSNNQLDPGECLHFTGE